jgi:hypothetical protein
MSADDDLVGVDLDKAIDSDGNIKAWAADIVRTLNSYTEISPSGTGLHIWVRGGLPHGGRQKRIEDGRLEVYEKARYFTVTGRHLSGTPRDISDWGGLIGEWYWSHFEVQTAAPPMPVQVDGDLDKEIEDALGYISSTEYSVWIAVGFAIKSHFGDAGFELWRQWSAKATNYCGDEKAWRKYRSFGKKEGVTYRTIFHMAMEEGYEPPKRYLDPEDIFPGIEAFCRALLEQDEPWTPEEVDVEPEVFDEAEEDKPAPTWAFDAADLRQVQSKRDYLIGPRVAGLGDVVVMAGPPKSMKSFIALDMLTHFACGEQWHGLVPSRPLRTLMLNCELHLDAVAERIQLLGKSPPPGSLYITDRIRTGISKGMVDAMKAHVEQHGPFDILVIDPIANLFTEADENDNKAMLTFLGHLVALRRTTLSDDAVLWLVHHARKSTLKELEADPFNALRGASALRGYYDAGIAVWKKGDGSIGVDFELRNGESIERMNLDFEKGIFGVAEALDKTSMSEMDLIESVMCSQVFTTVKALAEACEALDRVRLGKDAQSARTWTRRVNDCISMGKIRRSKEGLKWTE